MKTFLNLVLAVILILGCFLSTSFGFAPHPALTSRIVTKLGKAPLYGFLGDKEREKLTRDTEPEDFFKTNTDKMSDSEKLPLALIGIVAITLPFIAGLIALYAAK